MKSQLSQCQLGVYLDSVRMGGDVYHNANLFRLDPSLDAGRLLEAVRKVIAVHPLMSARIAPDEKGEPIMYVPDTLDEPELVEISDAEFEAMRGSLITPFELNGGRLGIFKIIRTESDLWIYFDYHHAITDGHSLILMLTDIDRAYNGETLEPEAVSGFEIAAAETEARLTPAYEKAKEWYKEVYGNVDTEARLYADLKGEKMEFRRRKFFLPVDPAGLRGGAPLCNAAMGVTLASFLHKEESLFTTITHGRKGHTTDRTFCMMVKTQPVRAKVGGDATIGTLLRDMKSQLIGNRRNDVFSFAEVSALTGISSEIMFAYQGRFLDLPSIGGHQIEREQLGETNTAIPMNLELFEDEDRVWLDASWRSDMYSDAAVETLADAFGHVLRQMAELPETTPLSEIEITDEPSRRQLRIWGDVPALEYDRTLALEELTAAKAAECPEATAVVFNGETLTRKRLQEEIARVAAELQRRGIGRGDTVGVMISRSPLMAVYPLAVQTAGAAYMPLDPEFPEERLMYMIGDAGVKTILTADGLAARVLPAFDRDRIIDFASIPEAGAVRPVEGKRPEDPLVVLYTSGSTGKPKGVTLSRGNILNFARDYIELTAMTEADRIPAYANFGFDAHMMDLYPTLISGAEYHVLDDAIRHDLDAMHEYFVDNSISVAFMTTQICYQMVTLYELPSMRCMSGGGEKLPPVPSLPYVFMNLYGPTECSVIATYFLTHGNIDGTVIGVPLPGYEVRIVDTALREVPQGVPGELVIMGEGVGIGYLNRPELNAEKFITLDGKPAYRTGDLARWNAKGEIHFLGRMDGMVKLRGLRIELGEIEAVATRHDAVRQFAAMVKTVGGNEQLVGYYSVKEGESLAPDELKEFMGGKLTEFMIPTILMELKELPLNPNGKVDRKALPVPQIEIAETELKAFAPGLEEELAAIVKEIIGHSAFGATTNLMKTGLTSLLSMRLVATVAKRMNVKIAAKDVMLEPTVRAMADKIEAAKGAAPEAKSTGTPKRKYYPLSENQRGVYIDWEMNRDALQYNVPQAIKLNDDVDPERLAEALREAVKAHPMLSARFVNRGGDIMQERNDDADPKVGIIDFDRLPSDEEIQRMIKPFDLNTGPLYRISILRAADGTVLLMDFHHIVFDGMSAAVFAQSVAQAYAGGHPERETYTAFERALDEHDLLLSDQADAAEEWFGQLLDGFTTTSYPHSPKPSGFPGQMGRLSLTMETGAIDGFCSANAVTPSNYFLSAFLQLLHRLTRQEKVAITTVNNGRGDVRLMEDVGMFVKTLPVVSSISAKEARELSPLEAAESVQRQFITTQGYDFYPFTSIVEKFGIRPEIMYVYEGGIDLDAEGSPLSGERIKLGLDTAKVPLTLLVFTPKEGEYELTVEFAESMYDSRDMQLLLRVMKKYSEGLAEAVTLAACPLLDEEAENELAGMRSGETGDVPYDSYHGAMEAWAEETPDATALVACDRTLSYGEFNSEANRIANALIRRGVERGDRVVVLLPRDSRLIAAIYGVMKTGAAYIPCDPDYPAERIKLITEDSEARYIVTTAEKTAIFGEKALDIDCLLRETDSRNPGVKTEPDDLAYLIYTSGSTGRPKGVKIHHAAIANYLYAYRRDFYLAMGENEPRVNMLLVTISFDASQVDLGTSLTSGHTLVLANEEETKDVVMLADLMKRTGVEAFDATPSRLAAMLELPAFREAIAGCKLLNIGGEGFPPSLLAKLAKAGFNGVVVNEYGPTETTVGSNHALLRPGDKVTAGRPFYNYREYIVDPWGGELPVGMTGELYIAGRGVGKGYHNLPDKTAESFVQFAGDGAYRTGDLARWAPNGNVEILGRIDNQVKLRGLRIELGEIESVATTFPGVRTACADVRKIGGMEHLCIWYESDSVDSEELKTHLSRHLTEYMVPDSYTQVSEMPLTPNGKADRKSLPEPHLEAAAEYVEPEAGLESQIAEAFRLTLNLEKVGANDDFFKIGGTSINAIKAVARLAGQGVNVSYKEIFNERTPRQLAAMLSGVKPETGTQTEKKECAPEGKYADILSRNSLATYLEGEKQPLGNVLLTGATGFMGIHMLHHLLRNGEGKVYCMVRDKGDITGASRLQTLYFYYFGEMFDDLTDRRLFILNGDLTDASAFGAVDASEIDTVVNCAANVKHFSAGDDIERVNVGSVRNIVDWCVACDKRLVHVSTVSVAGERVNGVPGRDAVLTERTLDLGQNLGNQYVKSKFEAEEIILKAIEERGLSAKIMRVGNLSARSGDGEFQINFRTNAFMGRLKAYLALGCVPYSHLDAPCEFSPIDEVCGAIADLATTPRGMTVFIPTNNHHIPLGDVLRILARTVGTEIREVEWSEFEASMSAAMADDSRVEVLQPLLAYSGDGGDTEYIGFSNELTTQVLYRLGFRWNYTSWDYVERFIKSLAALDYFDLND